MNDSIAAATAPHGTANTPYVIFLREGPSHSIQDALPPCEVLGSLFAGEMWTYGGYEADTQVAQFRLRVFKPTRQNRRLGYLQYMSFAKAHAAELARRGLSHVVVISYDPFKNGWLASSIARRHGWKFICEVNGAYGNPFNFVDEPRPWKRKVLRWAMRIVGSRVVRRADGVRLLYDDQLRDFATPRTGAVIRRHPDLAFIDRFYAKPEEPFILLVGYPYHRKGADLLSRAFMSLAERFPEWRLVLLGHQLGDGLRNDGLTHPRITALPGMPQAEVIDWVARCSILAQPSRSEAMGRVLLEAAAAGKCRLGSNVDGIPTVIRDGVDGVLVANEDVANLAENLARLMADPQLRARLGQAAKERAAREFTPQAFMTNLSNLVAAVANPGTGAGR